MERCPIEIGIRCDKMSTLFLICLAICHSIFVVSQSDEDHKVQNSLTTQDSSHEVYESDFKILLENPVSMMHILFNEYGGEYKIRRRPYPPLRTKRRTTHRPRTRPNAKSKISMKNNRKATTTPISDGTNLNVNVNAGNIFDNESSDDHYPFHGGLESLLARLIKALENDTRESDRVAPTAKSNSSAINNATIFDDEDRCQKWLDNREKIEEAFPGSVTDLPACPCQYPNGIFYENQIWDRKREKNFRWRDVSHDTDRLTIYKPGAAYCVQTLPSQESESAVAQHCCYDDNRKLLTRGSGAGTPYIVSPDISPLLHDKIDLLPWRLCKGDFTRYNKVRVPNNGNDCEINPDDEEYQHQVEGAKNY
ncbi:hypothetical protein P5V15_009355 [Pogonomyrmex californicus]